MASLLPSEVARLVLGKANIVGADVVGSSLENLNATTTKRFVHSLTFLSHFLCIVTNHDF